MLHAYAKNAIVMRILPPGSGFHAAITTCLANAGISVNAVIAFHHDHLFVPKDRADEAIRLLASLAAQSSKQQSCV